MIGDTFDLILLVVAAVLIVVLVITVTGNLPGSATTKSRGPKKPDRWGGNFTLGAESEHDESYDRWGGKLRNGKPQSYYSNRR